MDLAGVDMTALGEMVLWLHENPRAWVKRRFERYRLIDRRSMRRRVTLEFELSERIAERSTSGGLTVIPLALLEKRPLRGFELKAENGRKLPSLITAESTHVAHHVLQAAARRALNPGSHSDAASERATQRIKNHLLQRFGRVELEPEIVQDLAEIVGNDRKRTRAARERIEDAAGSTSRDAAEDQRRRLHANPEMKVLIADLADGFLLLTPRCVEPHVRCIWEFAYDDAFRTDDPYQRALFVRLGLMPVRVKLPTPAAARAASFHCEVEAPPDLEIVRARIDRGVRYVAEANWLRLNLTGTGRRTKRVTSIANRRIEARDGGGISRAHLHLPTAVEPVTNKAAAIVELRMKRGGFLIAAFLTCALAGGMLTASCHRLPKISENVEAATTLLLLVPGVLAAYLVRPGEHALAGALLLGTRVMLLAAACCSVIAGALLVAKLELNDLERCWVILRDVAIGAGFVVLLACVLPFSGRIFTRS